MFQGMNVNVREMESHIEFEPNTYYAAFSAELEASASQMWALVFHLKDTGTRHLTLNVTKQCLAAIKDWFAAINFTRPEKILLRLHPTGREAAGLQPGGAAAGPRDPAPHDDAPAPGPGSLL